MKHALLIYLLVTAALVTAQVLPKGPIPFDKAWLIEDIAYIPLNVDKAGSNIWGSIAINPSGLIIVGVANHVDNIAMYTYDSKKNQLFFEGNIMQMLHLNMKHWQSKIHTYIYWSPKYKKFFFGTDAGTYRSETIVEHPYGYIGGYWCWFDPAAHAMGTFGLNGMHRSVKGCVYSEVSGLLMGNTDPQEHFITCDVATGELNDYGRINGKYQPRVLFADKWGNGYTVDIFGELIKFDWKKKELIDLRVPMPRADKTEFYKAASGFKSIQMIPDGSVYGITQYAIAFHYIPVESGPGTMEDLGPTWGPDSGKWHETYSPNIAVIGDKMYYGMGGHGHYIDTVQKDVFLVEKDLKTKKVRVISRLKKIGEFTGSGIIDAQGNVYFGGHGQSISAEDAESKEAKAVKAKPKNDSKAYLVRFNPKKLAEKYAKQYEKFNQ